jgi:hypothetical protein
VEVIVRRVGLLLDSRKVSEQVFVDISSERLRRFDLVVNRGVESQGFVDYLYNLQQG